VVETALRKHAWSNRAEQWRACENKNPARVARAAARHVVKKLADWFFHGIAELSRKKLYTNVDLYTYSCTCTYHMLQESSFGLYIHDSESFRRLLCEETVQAPKTDWLLRALRGQAPTAAQSSSLRGHVRTFADRAGYGENVEN
jgi:hypothetical protein